MKRAGWAETAVVACVLTALVLAIQWGLGSFSAEIADDDTSHYISGLFIHDYFRAGLPNPLNYLKLYHSHYPLLGFGGWGPAYYVVEAAWMFVFSPGRISVVVLAGLVTAAIALALYLFCRRGMGRILSGCTALAFIIAPTIQNFAGKLMLDIPIALLCFGAMASFVRYLDTGRTVYSLTFALIASFAMLVKGTGAALALLPPLAIVIGHRYDFLRKPSFWLPLPIVAVLTGPWYWVSFGRAALGFRFHWGIDYFQTAIRENSLILWYNFGPLILIAAAIGFVAVLRGHKGPSNGLVGAAALAAAVWLFQSIVPAAIQDRYLAPLLAPLLVLAAWGIQVSVTRLGAMLRFTGVRAAVAIDAAAVVLLGSILPSALTVRTRVTPPPYAVMARQVWANRNPINPAVLIATNNQDEGSAIVELAMIDPRRPSLFAVRGSRLLGGGGYNRQDYLPLFQTPQQVMQQIDKYSIPLVILRRDPARDAWAHIGQLEQARQLYPDRWELIYRNDRVSPEIDLYRIRGNVDKRGDQAKLIALSMPNALRDQDRP